MGYTVCAHCVIFMEWTYKRPRISRDLIAQTGGKGLTMTNQTGTTNETRLQAPAYEMEPSRDKYAIVYETLGGGRMVLTAPTIEIARKVLAYNVQLMGPKAALCVNNGYTPANIPAGFVKAHKPTLVACREGERLFLQFNPRRGESPAAWL